MDMHLRIPGPLHYLIHEQAKSVVYLQELHNEVGSLLEFRDLVLSTFPQLQGKEIRKPSPPDPGGGAIPKPEETSDEHLTWSTGSAASGKQRRTLVQDSGFSTETKEHHSSSTLASPGGHASGIWSEVKAPPVASVEEEDELWQLLDAIHRKAVRLREEVDDLHEGRDDGRMSEVVTGPQSLPVEGRRRKLPDLRRCIQQQRRRSVGSTNSVDQVNEIVSSGSDQSSSPQLALAQAEVIQLRKERHMLLERLNGLERVALLSQARTGELERRMRRLSEDKRSLEAQLRTAVSLKAELNSKIHDLHSQFVRTNGFRNRDTSSNLSVTRDAANFYVKGVASSNVMTTPSPTSHTKHIPQEPNRARVNKVKVGALDSVLGVGEMISKLQTKLTPDRCKIQAVLKEINVVELQRQILALLIIAESLRSQSNEWSNSQRDWENQRVELESKNGALTDANDDLHIKLHEQLIELEGTRARLRLLSRSRHPELQSAGTQTDSSTSWVLPPSVLNKPTVIIPTAKRCASVQTDPLLLASNATKCSNESSGLLRFEVAIPNSGPPTTSPKSTLELKRPSRIPMYPKVAATKAPSPLKRDGMPSSVTPKHSRRQIDINRKDSFSSSTSSIPSTNLRGNKEGKGVLSRERLSFKDRSSHAHQQHGADKVRPKQSFWGSWWKILEGP